MKEHPILFSTEMVQAILAGRKTQTRRTVKMRDSTLMNDEDLSTHIDGSFDKIMDFTKTYPQWQELQWKDERYRSFPEKFFSVGQKIHQNR